MTLKLLRNFILLTKNLTKCIFNSLFKCLMAVPELVFPLSNSCLNFVCFYAGGVVNPFCMQ